MNTREFLGVLYEKVDGGYIGASYLENGKTVTKWFSSSALDNMASYIIQEGAKHNTYYCVNPRVCKLPSYKRGSADDIDCVVAAYADFDVLSTAHAEKNLPETREQVLAFLDKASPMKPTVITWTGNGIHALWLFNEPYEVNGDPLYIGSVLKGWELYLKGKAYEMYGWRFDSVADIARMLRAPGTTNFKTESKPLCEVIQYEDVRYSVEEFMDYAVQEQKCNAKPTDTLDDNDFFLMGTGSADELVQKCEFLKYCRDNATTFSEPLWQAMISNVALTADGHDKVHELSSPYPKYTYAETEKKYKLAAKNDMPITCKVIHERGYTCKNCNYNVKAPISLIRECASKPIEWEQPISFDDFILPDFPTEALPEPIRNYVVALAESTQTPVDMAATSALAVMSVCLQGKYRIKAKDDWSEPLNTFVLNIMEPSERKSAVENAMIKPINAYEAEQNTAKAAIIEKSRTRKQILEQKQKAMISQAVKGKADMTELDTISEELANFKEEKPLKLYVDDITTEKLTSVLADNDGRAAILSTEGGIFDTLAGIYTKNVNIDVILKGYSGDSIRVDRIGRQSESVMTPALTMLLMAQPSVLSGLMGNGTFRGRGLTARFLYCMPASKVGSRRYRTAPVSMEVYGSYEKCIRNMLEDDYEKEPEDILLSEEADKLIEAYAEELEPLLKTEYSCISDWAGKLVGNILRIAGLLYRASVSRCHDFLGDDPNLVVNAETMQKAIDIGNYFIEHAKAVFSLMGVDETIKQSRYVLGAIRNAGLAELTRRDVQRLCRSFKKADELQPVLDNLVDYGYLSVIDDEKYSGKGRRPAVRYAVNPYVYNEE